MRSSRVIRFPGVVLPLLAVCALVPAGAEAQRAEGSFEQTLTVSGAPDIEVVTGSGSIEVRSGAAGRIEIVGRVQANDGWSLVRQGGLSPEERVRRIEANPPVTQNGNVVRIGRIDDEDLRRNVSISYTVTVPAESQFRSKTGSGSQRVEGVRGGVEAGTGSGSLTLRDLGGSVRASTGSGSIQAETIGGGFDACTGSGSIRAAGVTGPIKARTGSGGIDVEQRGSGDVQISSGSGSVRLRGVRGGLQASTGSGGITVEGVPAGDWRLSAASGRVNVSLPPGQGFELDAGTGSGSIDVGMPVTVVGTVSRRALRGSVQGGGPLLHVRTSSGGIRIQ